MRRIEPTQYQPKAQMRDMKFALHYNFDEDVTRISVHRHHYYEFYFVIDGHAVYSVDNKTYELEAGDVLLIKPEQTHFALLEPLGGRPYVRYVLWLDPAYLSALSSPETDLLLPFEKFYDLSSLVHLYGETQVTVTRLLQSILRSQAIGEFGADLYAHAHMIELLVTLGRVKLYNQPSGFEDCHVNNKLVNAALEYITEHIHERIRTDELAATLFVSRSHLSREFTKFMGIPVRDFIIKKKLYLSKLALMEGAGIQEVCARYDFGDYSSFYRAFKKEFGLSPQKFVNEQ